MSIVHQHLAHAINRRLAAERENASMEEVAHHATPLFYAVMLAAVGVIGGCLIDEYAATKHAGSVKTASTFAQCLNGKSVAIDGSILRCEVKQYALVGGLK